MHPVPKEANPSSPPLENSCLRNANLWRRRLAGDLVLCDQMENPPARRRRPEKPAPTVGNYYGILTRLAVRGFTAGGTIFSFCRSFSFVGRAFRHDVRSACPSGVLAPEGRVRLASALTLFGWIYYRERRLCSGPRRPV